MSASVATWHNTEGVYSVMEGNPVPCASVLKPIFAWSLDHPEWDDLAERMVVSSDNAATDELTGENVEHLSQAIARRTNVLLDTPSTWGQFTVTAVGIANMYSVFAKDDSLKATRVRELMGQVPKEQRLGFYGPLKAGWDMYEDEQGVAHLVTNMVIFTENGGIAITNDDAVDNDVALQWKSSIADGPEKVIPLHLNAMETNMSNLFGQGISHIVFAF